MTLFTHGTCEQLMRTLQTVQEIYEFVVVTVLSCKVCAHCSCKSNKNGTQETIMAEIFHGHIQTSREGVL